MMMSNTIINTRADLDALAGTPAYDVFMASLEGSLWRVERDEAAQTFVAIEDNSTIERFGFTRTDFPESIPPNLPEWKPKQTPIYICSPWQIRKALNEMGLRQAVEDSIAISESQMLKDGWQYANEFRSDDPFVLEMGAEMGKTPEETAALIQYASTL